MTQVKTGGSWTSVGVSLKTGGSWVDPVTYVKTGGLWKLVHQPVPPNMVILYPQATDVSASKYGTIQTSWYGKFPRGEPLYGSLLTTGGSSTHNGADHGASGLLWSDWYAFVDGIPGASHSWMTCGSHRHLYTSHTHGGTADHTPVYKDLCPVIGAAVIKTGAVFLAKVAAPADFTSYAAAIGKMLRFGASAGSGGAATHTHDSASSIWDNYQDTTVTGREIAWGTSAGSAMFQSDRGNHNHGTWTHTPPAVANLPPALALNPIQWGGADRRTIDFLPSGTVAFFTSSALPLGWTQYATVDSRGVTMASTGLETASGSATHNHIGTGSSGLPSVSNNTNSGVWVLPGLMGHSHTITDSHATALDGWPPWIKLYAGVKS